MYTYGVEEPRLISMAGTGTWDIIAFVLAIVGAFLVYFLFLKSKNKLSKKFVVWLKNFLDFKELLIEPILKISYIFVALYITLSSFGLISFSFALFILYLIFGNIVARLVYELLMLVIAIWSNTKDINKKLK